MKKELPHFKIGYSYGGNQEWFSSYIMRLGGCAAETAVECCIYLDLYKGTVLCPIDVNGITRESYSFFGNIMKPYLHPRIQGIDSLNLYIDGFGKYLKDKNSNISLKGLDGSEPYEIASKELMRQIDKGIPVPFLCLYHNSRRFHDYEWHWFIINGYELLNGSLMAKAVTYSSYEWLPFEELWNTGRQKKGGMILISL